MPKKLSLNIFPSLFFPAHKFKTKDTFSFENIFQHYLSSLSFFQLFSSSTFYSFLIDRNLPNNFLFFSKVKMSLTANNLSLLNFIFVI